MSDIDFLYLISENIGVYFLIIIFIAPIYGIFYFKKLLGLFDILTLALIGSCFSTASVIFLCLFTIIEDKFIVSYFTNEIAFFIGFYFLSPNKSNLKFNLISRSFGVNINSISIKLNIIFLLYSTFKLFQYYLIGVPFFTYNRLSMAEGTGFGFLQTFSFGLLPIICFLIVASYREKLISNHVNNIFVIILFIFSVLDGSKGGALFIVQIIFMAYMIIFNDNKILINKNQKLIFTLIIFIPILLPILTKYNTIEEGLLFLAFRFAAYGDTFYLGYSNAVIDLYEKSAGFYTLLVYPILATLKIVAPSQNIISIGEFLNQIANNSFEGGGPNSRLYIVSYIILGDFGFVLSLAVGLLVGYSRKLIINNNGNFNIRLLHFLFIVSSASLWLDPSLWSATLTIYISVYLVWIMVDIIICKGENKCQ